MRFGAVFPQTEIGADPVAVRDFAQAAEALGYDHLLVFDHVTGVNAERADWDGLYTHRHMFHEVLTLLAYLAGVTSRIELATGILILPQRQTVLVAKQAAEVDVLSGGRLRLGIGIGWSAFEYEALGENFHDRGRRSEEQIAVMRALWTEDIVNFEGEWHKITDSGINPLPVQRPIPIWFGGNADAVVRRIARIGDGWIPFFAPDEKGRAAVAKLHDYAREAGRDPADIGIERMLLLHDTPSEKAVQVATAYAEMGVTTLSLNTMNAGLDSPSAHMRAIRLFKEAVAGM